MTHTTSRDLKVLICEDEYLLAIDLAQQLEALQAQVVGIVGSLGDLREAIQSNATSFNAVVLDVQFADGRAYDVIPLLEEQGLATAISSGYGPEERPPEYAHIPWITKPTTADHIAAALCAARDARRPSHSV